MAAGDKIKWEDADFKWNEAIPGNIYTWIDVKVLEEANVVDEIKQAFPNATLEELPDSLDEEETEE